MLDERRLHRVEFVALGETLDGRDLLAVVREREREAGVDPAAVDEHRATAALAVVATLFCTGHLEAFAQGVEQGHARIDLELFIFAVDAQGERDGLRACGRGRILTAAFAGVLGTEGFADRREPLRGDQPRADHAGARDEPASAQSERFIGWRGALVGWWEGIRIVLHGVKKEKEPTDEINGGDISAQRGRGSRNPCGGEVPGREEEGKPWLAVLMIRSNGRVRTRFVFARFCPVGGDYAQGPGQEPIDF